VGAGGGVETAQVWLLKFRKLKEEDAGISHVYQGGAKDIAGKLWWLSQRSTDAPYA